jgi:RNA recognition motif-containing protein
LMRSKHDGKCLGYGFITFTHLYSAMQAIEQANGTVLLGRTLM